MLKNKKNIIWILLPIPGWKKVLLYELLLITRVYIFIKNSNPRFPHFFNVKHQNRREWYNLITHHEVVYNHLPGKSHRIFEFLWVNTMENNFVVCKSTWRQKQRRQKKKTTNESKHLTIKMHWHRQLFNSGRKHWETASGFFDKCHYPCVSSRHLKPFSKDSDT